uniref:Armadillo repeat containing 3 n=1 Tax=Sander lucioperca TaxID=283035 RepID=A0A8C9X6I6_SANLU
MGKKVKKESETPCKETFEPLPVEGKTPATVVLLLSCPEEDILVKACEAIHTFAEKGDENKVSLLGLGALEPLCQLITHNNKLIRRNAFMALGIMATNGDIKSALKKIDVIPSIIDKLSLEGIPPLLELLKSDFPVIQHLALKTLQNVTTDTDTCNTFREEQGFEKLMDILSNMDFHDLHAEALQVVANCLSDSKSLQVIHKGGGLTRLMEFVLTPNLPEIQSNAVKCIARVAQSSENRKLLHEQNVEKVLVELLSVADISVKTATCQAVSIMSFHLASKDSFRDLNGIPAVVQLLNNESLKLKEAATQALSNLTHGNQLNAFAAYEAGGDKILVQQLYGSCRRTVANSADALGNMAGQEVIRCSILSHGAIQALVEPLQSTDTQVLINTTLCLTVLACDTEARAELQSAGGLHPLVNLLRSYHKEVLHHACLAINVCASDVNAAVEMCQFGALEMLQEINLSVNRRSRFSELAMISLLNFNLSVKYSLTSHLASTDIISDGFYDAGKVRYVLLKLMCNRGHLKECELIYKYKKKLLSNLQTCS